MKIILELSQDDFVDGLEFETHEQAFQMIKAIDRQMADFDFTLSVIRDLVAELKLCVGDGDEPLTAKDIGL
ncbi:hypothetical protein LMG26685_02930 [Achromobacter mucicolens]|uniref:hypothetical protein n=1 Tax=Achromobacter mucicolens TaxID=1389922 RepID=UPI0009D4E3AD|nr:hypothetical protein [Achromobacter mucicolens]OXC90994.1 hypothetical protein BMR85_007280 [Achromobacter sp. KAs 3-5]CAB3654545.1 hypothetical protein LMG26685_02930 [Achromobacter mucicolens]